MAENQLPQDCRPIDLYWVAGFIEGEGTFSGYKRNFHISAAQVQREPLDRMVRIVGGTIIGPTKKNDNPRHQPIHIWRICGKSAIEWMLALRPIMSPKRQEQLDRALHDYFTTVKLRGEGVGGYCIRGHHVVEGNLYSKGGGRFRCKACMDMHLSNHRKKHGRKSRAKSRLKTGTPTPESTASEQC